jgi:nitrite reductase/ring-hydroxylating ferredoxin subunit
MNTNPGRLEIRPHRGSGVVVGAAGISGLVSVSPLEPAVRAIEGLGALDTPAKAIGKKVRDLLNPGGGLKDVLSGTWLGHALHPLLTDVVVGSFTSATLLDLLGGDDEAVQKLIGVGIAAYGPTALTGVNDWADAEPVDDRVRRVGLIHASTNAVGLAFYTASLRARRSGDTGRGKALALAGAGVMGVGGFLGGHLSFTRGIGPNQTAYDEGPGDWTDAMAASDLQDAEPKGIVVGDTPVFIMRHGDHFHAIHDRCSHRGCSLSEMGEVEKETVTCGCHGSQFSLRDGAVQRGPATAAQPAYEVRERDGRLELRLSQ